MPRFSVGFGRRKTAPPAEEFQNAQFSNESSFRVLERTEVAAGKSFDGGVRMSRTMPPAHRPSLSQVSVEDNMFAGLKANRGSGSSNTTKTASTDASSRHSNVSTAPSSADIGHQGVQEEWKGFSKKAYGEMAAGPAPAKPPSRGFLERAGRTFSFGGQKKNVPVVPSFDEHPVPAPPPLPTNIELEEMNRRPRGFTSSTTSTATPPKLDEENDFTLDMGSDFGQMFDNKYKRNSVMTLRASAHQQQHQQEQHQHPEDGANGGRAAPRSLTGNRASQQPPPAPIHIDKSANIEPSPYSWSSQHSHDNLLSADARHTSPPPHAAPAPPRHANPKSSNSRPSDIAEDTDASFLKDSLVATRFLNDSGEPNHGSNSHSGRFRRNESPGGRRNVSSGKGDGDENLFEGSLARSSRLANRYVTRAPSPPRNKVMTPAQFERYRQDLERQSMTSDDGGQGGSRRQDDDDEDNYEDEDDEAEKAKQAAKQRRKQEAHMTVYRQQMMKVTGEAAGPAFRPHLPVSLSSPNLSNLGVPGAATTAGKSDEDGEDEDEEIPLAILAAHGFPNRNKPPNRLSTMASNPDMRASMQPPPARPGSSMGEGSGANAGGNRASHLPAFARRLPQDPFLGAGLVNGPPRESMNFSGGAAAPNPSAPLPPGGLVGVIANEERSRAMRRGSPHVDSQGINAGGHSGYPGPAFDPAAGIPPQMMYNMGGMGMPQMPHMPPQMMLTPGDQAQIQMNQQMQQFMQMQMQFMQMMTGGQGAAAGGRPMSHMPSPMTPDVNSRQSFLDPASSYLDPSRPALDPRMRTMSMVQPSSESWIQPGGVGYAPSIHAQGVGYAPSIAPSERSNVGLPGRYRPVSQVPQLGTGGPGSVQDFPAARRTSTMSGALAGWDQPNNTGPVKKLPSPAPRTSGTSGGKDDDDDDDEGWEAMKAKREKKRSIWRSKKTIGSELGAFIS